VPPADESAPPADESRLPEVDESAPPADESRLPAVDESALPVDEIRLPAEEVVEEIRLLAVSVRSEGSCAAPRAMVRIAAFMSEDRGSLTSSIAAGLEFGIKFASGVVN
jgi:hypothetical protein